MDFLARIDGHLDELHREHRQPGQSRDAGEDDEVAPVEDERAIEQLSERQRPERSGHSDLLGRDILLGPHVRHLDTERPGVR